MYKFKHYIFTLSLHDALPILDEQMTYIDRRVEVTQKTVVNAFLLFKSGLANYLEVLTAQSNAMESELEDRKSTRLNSSHVAISYAVFCLKKKKTNYRKKPTTV